MASSNQTKGAVLGLSAAALFGLSAPLSKLLLPSTGPLVLAALLYLGGGAALIPFARTREAKLTRADVPLLAAIALFGGVLGPVLMLFGLARMSGFSASLLLNLEGPLTVLFALALFGEHIGKRAAGGIALIFVGGALVGVVEGQLRADPLGVAALVGACGVWALDNNLTQRLSLKDPVAIVRWKALGAGTCTLLVAVAAKQPLPPMAFVASALAIGAVSYGLSILLDTFALRQLGAAREAGYFATAPFIGALAAVPLLGDRPSSLAAAGGLVMAAGVVLLVRERHAHLHTHQPLEHDHEHVHDEHHQHAHEGPWAEPHSHPHVHVALTHDHPHVSDVHHRHEHGRH